MHAFTFPSRLMFLGSRCGALLLPPPHWEESLTNYAGIDYGLGTSNRDPKTGVRYGIIRLHSLSEWAPESFEPYYGEPTCPHCGHDLVEWDSDEHEMYLPIEDQCYDYACETCEICVGSEDAYGDEPIGHNLDDGEYSAALDSYGDVMLFKSPYCTRAQFCSPCAPGAGHLDSPCTTGPVTYCFGHDWFEGGHAPYPVFCVKTGKLVPPKE